MEANDISTAGENPSPLQIISICFFCAIPLLIGVKFDILCLKWSALFINRLVNWIICVSAYAAPIVFAALLAKRSGTKRVHWPQYLAGFFFAVAFPLALTVGMGLPALEPTRPNGAFVPWLGFGVVVALVTYPLSIRTAIAVRPVRSALLLSPISLFVLSAVEILMVTALPYAVLMTKGVRGVLFVFWTVPVMTLIYFGVLVRLLLRMSDRNNGSPARFLKVCGIVFGVCFVVNLCQSGIGYGMLRQSLAVARREGLRPENIRLKPMIVPPERNAARFYEQAAKIAGEPLWRRYKAFMSEEWNRVPAKTTGNGPVVPWERDYNREYRMPIWFYMELWKNERSWRNLSDRQIGILERFFLSPETSEAEILLKRAEGLPDCQFTDEEFSPFAEFRLGSIQKLADSMRIRAFLLLHRGRLDEACRCTFALLHFEDSVWGNSHLTSALTKLSGKTRTFKMLGAMANALPDKEFDKFYPDAMRTLGAGDGLLEGFENEIILYGDWAFQNVYHGKVSIHGPGNPLYMALQQTFVNPPRGIQVNIWFWSILRPYVYVGARRFLDLNLSGIAYLEQPYYLVQEKVKAWEHEYHYGELQFCWIPPLIPMMYKPLGLGYPKKQADYFARRDGVMLLCALRMYNIKHHRWPDSLSDLVPSLLPILPKDAFTGNDFIYRKTADGCIVYSVGKNGQDNGGINDYGKNIKGPIVRDDLVWTLQNTN